MLWILVAVVLAQLTDTAEGGCSGSITDLVASSTATQYFTSPSYPNSYPNNQLCQWRLGATSGNTRVFVSTKLLSLEENYDYISFYDGDSASSSLYQTTDTELVTFVSSGRYAFVQFESDYSVTYGGFYIEYVEVDTTSDSCGSSLSAPTASPAQINLYYIAIGASATCSWTVTTVGSNTIVILLLYVKEDFDFISLNVYDGSSSSSTLLGTITRYTQMGSGYVTTGTSAFLEYNGNTISGLILTYQAGQALTTPDITTQTTTIRYECNTVLYLTAYSTPQLLVTPGYPNQYPNNLYCTALITASDPSNSINITITDGYLPSCCDSLSIYDGSSDLYEILAQNMADGNSVVSTGNAIFLVFQSDASGTTLGLKGEYREVTRTLPSCVPTTDRTDIIASTSSVTITSPGYPSSYSNNVVVYWLITKPNIDDNIVLKSTATGLEYSNDCRYDSVTIFDGPCTDEAEIAKFCGSTVETYEDSTGANILIRFETDYSVVASGFSMEIYIGQISDDDGTDEIVTYIVIIVVVVIGVIIVAAIAFTVWRCNARHRNRVRQSGGVTSHAAATKPQRLQVTVLLDQLKQKADIQPDKKAKPKRKDLYALPVGGSGYPQTPTPHPPPNPFQGHPPFPGPSLNDPAYPPGGPPLPQMPPGYGQFAIPAPQPQGPVHTDLEAPPVGGMIPMPFQYLSPVQARDLAATKGKPYP